MNLKTKTLKEVIDKASESPEFVQEYSKELGRLEAKKHFLSLITKLKQELLADKENPVSGIGALMMLEKML